MKVALGIVITMLAAPGCKPAQESPQVREAQPMPSARETPQPATRTPRAETTIKLLAARLGVAPESITVIESRQVTWADGSLGCPEPGMMYTQALVPGELIVLEAGGRRYRFHASLRGEPFECPEGRAQEPAAARQVVAQ